MIPKHKRKNTKLKLIPKAIYISKYKQEQKNIHLIWDTVFDNSVRWKPLNE